MHPLERSCRYAEYPRKPAEPQRSSGSACFEDIEVPALDRSEAAPVDSQPVHRPGDRRQIDTRSAGGGRFGTYAAQQPQCDPWCLLRDTGELQCHVRIDREGGTLCPIGNQLGELRGAVEVKLLLVVEAAQKGLRQLTFIRSLRSA